MTLLVQFTDAVSGAAFDPSVVTLQVKRPSGVVDTPAVNHDSLGNFSAAYTPLLDGLHSFIFIGKDGGGNPIAGGRNTFRVDPLAA